MAKWSPARLDAILASASVDRATVECEDERGARRLREALYRRMGKPYHCTISLVGRNLILAPLAQAILKTGSPD